MDTTRLVTKEMDLKTLYPAGYFSQECGLTILKLLSKVKKMSKCIADKESQVSSNGERRGQISVQVRMNWYGKGVGDFSVDFP